MKIWIALLVIAAAALAWWAGGVSARPALTATPVVSTTSAPVTRGDVVERVKVAGVLGYAGSYPVVSQLPLGIVTALAAGGSVVRRGGDLFAVSGTRVALFYGATPAYRDFGPGMSDGPDVRQLERNLVALGLDPGHAITVDGHFTRATTAAVARWQARRGVPPGRRDGVVRLGQVIFLPGAVRVGEVALREGVSVTPGTRVMSASSTRPVATVPLGADRRTLVHVRDRVEVTLPTGDAVTGSVTRVGRITSGGRDEPTVTVTIRLTLPKGSGDVDQTPVQVAILTERRRDVLRVPVTALLAGPGTGYQVRVMGSPPRLVEVTPGLYDDDLGLVEIAGSGLETATRVEVPAQ